jgi:hypothetical protein
MINSSILNPISFKNINGLLPNRWNTMHNDLPSGAFYIKKYFQIFDYGDIVQFQIQSDDSTIPTCRVYANNLLIETISGTLASSYEGDEGSRYFFNYSIEFDSAYNNKEITIKVTKDSDLLQSEPIKLKDMSIVLNSARYKRIEYTNYDRNSSDFNDFSMDWSVITTTDKLLYFYVEAIDDEINNEDTITTLDGCQSKKIIAANFTPGCIFKTSGIPFYVSAKLTAASSLDYFAINSIEYVKTDGISTERLGNSTLFQATLTLVEKNSLGINVDNLTITETDSMENEISNTIITGVLTDTTVSTPDGFGLHYIRIKHNTNSSGNNATVMCGSTVGGDEYIVAEAGEIISGQSQSYDLHDTDSDNIYFTISGTGIILDIFVQFLKNT